MSTTSTPSTEETYECSHCGDPRRPSTSVAGSFCSIGCHREHRREKRAGEVLRELEQDHRFCATCSRQLKEISCGDHTLVVGPSRHDDWTFASDVWAGYQHRTEHAETGEISLDTTDEPAMLTDDRVATGTVCECGNTDHRHEEPAIRTRAPFETAHYLALAVDVLREEGKHDVRVDRRELVDAVLEQAVPVQGTAIDLRAALAAAVVLDE